VSMSTTSLTDLKSEDAAAPVSYSFARLMAWCIRRELWENRSIIIAPFTATGLMIFAILIPVVKLLADPLRFELGADARGAFPTDGLWIPYTIIAAPVLAIGLLVAIAYCLNALHGERRDRSILFWKSLPVSDLNTVMSKAGVPLVLVPLVSFAAAVVAQLAIFAIVLLVFPLVAAKAHLVWNGMPVDYRTVGRVWAGVPVGYLTLAMLYGLFAMALWHAPIYAWLLLVGGWARRLTFVWAVAPLGGLMIVERISFGTQRLEALFEDRLLGIGTRAFSEMGGNALPGLTPGRFLFDPALWIGLAVAVLFLGAAVLLRRYRQPM
jgi:ABC-2 type transport system permease protein